jgi:DNA repair exonuclease SbcCD ATPase subunit
MSRVVIWTIVAIVVVLGVIFIVTSRRQAATMQAIKPLSDEAYEKYTSRMDRQINQFTRSIDRLKAKYPSPTTEIQSMLNELDNEMAAFVTAVENLKGKTTTEEREESYTTTQSHIKALRRLIRDLRGSTTD